MSEHAMRVFYEGVEVTLDQAREWERQGRAHVARAGSGVVPAYLQQPDETSDHYLRPWMLLLRGPARPPASPAPVAAENEGKRFGSNPDVGPRCGECRLGLGVHNTADPLCDHHDTEEQP